MDVSKLRDLIELMNENDLLEIEIEEEGKKIRLKKKAPHEGHALPPVMVAASGALPLPVTQAPTAGAADEGKAVPGRDSNATTMTSPMVGTFYRSSSPDADPFVDVGDEVGPETVMCVIEAMKVMNEIKAEVSGKILEILVQNGEPVEYGQPLFVLQPHG